MTDDRASVAEITVISMVLAGLLPERILLNLAERNDRSLVASYHKPFFVSCRRDKPMGQGE